jgi:hypothetical protein
MALVTADPENRTSTPLARETVFCTGHTLSSHWSTRPPGTRLVKIFRHWGGRRIPVNGKTGCRDVRFAMATVKRSARRAAECDVQRPSAWRVEAWPGVQKDPHGPERRKPMNMATATATWTTPITPCANAYQGGPSRTIRPVSCSTEAGTRSTPAANASRISQKSQRPAAGRRSPAL